MKLFIISVIIIPIIVSMVCLVCYLPALYEDITDKYFTSDLYYALYPIKKYNKDKIDVKLPFSVLRPFLEEKGTLEIREDIWGESYLQLDLLENNRIKTLKVGFTNNKERKKFEKFLQNREKTQTAQKELANIQLIQENLNEEISKKRANIKKYEMRGR